MLSFTHQPFPIGERIFECAENPDLGALKIFTDGQRLVSEGQALALVIRRLLLYGEASDVTEDTTPQITSLRR